MSHEPVKNEEPAKSEKPAKPNRLLTYIVILLTASVAYESYALLRMEKKIDRHFGPQVKTSTSERPSPQSEDPLFNIPIEPDWDWFDGHDDQWNLSGELNSLRERMNRMFEDAFGRMHNFGIDGAIENFTHMPPLDLKDEKDRYVVRMDIPGAEKNEIDVRLEGNRLTISATRNEAVEEKEGNKVLRRERQTGRFERTLTLPSPVAQKGMNAKYENGVLTVTIPKGKKGQGEQKIVVQ